MTADGEALTGLHMEGERGHPDVLSTWRENGSWFRVAKAQLEGYFAAELKSFDRPLALGGTEFQRRVWQALLTIPYGSTRSYSALAAEVGNPQASRAVGLANGRNPIPIIIPCHRVIGQSGALTGYGGGLVRKAWLLRHEQQAMARGWTV